MKLHHVILLIACLVIVGVFGTLTYYFGFYMLERHEIPIDFRVEKGVAGIDADSDALHFGAIPPGGYSRRRMDIVPAHDARLVITIEGDAAGMTAPSRNDFLVSEGKQVELEFRTDIPTDAAEGNYTGTAVFTFYRP